MVTLHLLKLLEDNGFGVIDQVGSDWLGWQEAPLDKDGNPTRGTWIVSRGAPVSRLGVGYQQFDIYSRSGNKIETFKRLESILHFLQLQYHETCELPLVPPYSDTLYYNCRIQPTSGIEHVGTDEQDMVVMSISGEIRFAATLDNV